MTSNIIVFLSVLIFLFVLIGIIAKVSTYKRDNESGDSKKKWLDKYIKNCWKAVVGIFGCHILVFYFWPDLWKSLAKLPIFWIDHFVIFIIFWLFTKESKDKKMVLTFWGNALVVILFVGNMYQISIRWSLGEKKSNPTTNYRDMRFKPSALGSVSVSASTNTEGMRMVREFLEKKNLSPKEFDEMFEIPHRESDYHQFESDGKTPLHGKENPKDTGVYQINSDWYEKEISQPETPEEVKSYDIKTPEGNMEYALYLYKKYGTAPWKSSLGGGSVLNERTIIIQAPTGGWSEKIFIPDLNRFPHITYSRGDTVTIHTSEGRSFTDGPGVKTLIGLPSWIEFRSMTGKPVNVYVTPFK